MAEGKTPRPDTVRLQGLANAHWQAALLHVCVELDLFTVIARGADTAERVAAATRLSPLNAERLLAGALALGLVERQAGRLRNATDVERFLVTGSPSYAGPWMLFNKPRWAEWGNLAEHLRDAQAERIGRHVRFDVDEARAYHAATFSIGLGAGRRFVRQVDLRGRRRLMDLGGGSGAYCIASLQAHPELTAVVLDLPPVVVVAREYIARHGLGDRLSAQPCDFTADALPADADVVVMASNLPQYGPRIIAAVVAKVFRALLPGGEFHLIGEMLNADGIGPPGPAMWGLNEALSHSTGRAHSVAECLDYLRNAGFVETGATEFVPQTLTRVIGRKPG
ncbi:MAG: hypothetical protein FJX68_17910 [Alphaproteobacteria bacterium]|nr:hypothetical protein [Alphaproteobacteria bacterium]